MNVFKTVHHYLDDRVSDLSLLKRESMYDFFELRIIEVVSLRSCLNFTQLACVFVRFALLYALLRIRICFLIKVVIHGGSVDRIVTCLLGIQESVISIKCS